MVFTALQFASFAFTPQTLPTVSQEFRDAVGFMQNIVLLSSADMFAASFVATQGCVGALLAVMLVQESVEFGKFRSPERKAWQFLWLALSGFAGVCVTVFFVPITKMLLRAVDWNITAVFATKYPEHVCRGRSIAHWGCITWGRRCSHSLRCVE